MGCTYCGKEIGTLRLLRDNEFCTSKHRKLYRERLNKVLGEALTDVAAPASVADSASAWPSIRKPVASREA